MDISQNYKLPKERNYLVARKILDKTKNGEVVEVVLVYCNLVYNQYKNFLKYYALFIPNKSYVYLLNIEPSNLVLLKTYNTEFDERQYLSRL